MKRFIAKKKEDLENQTQKTVEQPLLLGLPTVEPGGMDILHSNLQQEGRERPLPSILQQGDVDGDSPILLNPSPRRRRQRLNLSPICQLDGDDSQPGPLSVEKVINKCLKHEDSIELALALHVVLGIALPPCDDSPYGPIQLLLSNQIKSNQIKLYIWP